MKKTIKGIVIDPKNRTITHMDIPTSIYAYYEIIDCDAFDICTTPALSKKSSIIYVDDLGLLKDNYQFVIEGVRIAGKAMVVGGNPSGDDVDTTITVKELLALVKWDGFHKLKPNNYQQVQIVLQTEYISILMVSAIVDTPVEKLEDMLVKGIIRGKMEKSEWFIHYKSLEKLIKDMMY